MWLLNKPDKSALMTRSTSTGTQCPQKTWLTTNIHTDVQYKKTIYTDVSGQDVCIRWLISSPLGDSASLSLCAAPPAFLASQCAARH
jgi:hypothetical protein